MSWIARTVLQGYSKRISTMNGKEPGAYNSHIDVVIIACDTLIYCVDESALR